MGMSSTASTQRRPGNRVRDSKYPNGTATHTLRIAVKVQVMRLSLIA